jgi:hypothetical protein
VRATTSGRAAVWILLVLAIALLGPVAWAYSSLHWSYSEGERVGYIQKFSRKGYLCKTWEGELAMVSVPGSTPEKFYFSVREDAVAAVVNKALGRRVALSYQQHVGVPTTCFGETEYFVTAATVVEEPR